MATATGAERSRSCAFGLVALLAVVLGSTSAAVAQEWRILPRVALREAFTDNVRLEPKDVRESDFITEVIPGVQVNHTGAKLKLDLDYQLTALFYAKESSANDVRHRLDANGTFEAIDNFFFIDARAAIAQEIVSALGPRPSSDANISNNRTESRGYQISPYIRGRMQSFAEYTVRYSFGDFNTSGVDTGNSQVQQITAALAGVSTASRFNWGLDVGRQILPSQFGRTPYDDIVRASLNWQPTYDLRVTGHFGWERSNYATLQEYKQSIYGADFTWTPSPRTKVGAGWEQRFFGTAWNGAVQYRTPRVALRASTVRELTTEAQRLVDPWRNVTYNVLYDALTVQIPDPVLRAFEARRLLQEGIIPPELGLPGSFLTEPVYVNQTHDISMALTGVRNTVSLRASFSDRRPLTASLDDELQLGGSVREYGGSANWLRRLTPLASVSAYMSWRRSSTATVGANSKQWDTRLSYITRFGPRTSGSLEMRHVFFDSDVIGNPGYRENALTASVLYRF